MRYLDSPEPSANERPFLDIPSHKRYIIPGSPQIKYMHSHSPTNKSVWRKKVQLFNKEKPQEGLHLNEQSLNLQKKGLIHPRLSVSVHLESVQFCSSQALPSPFFLVCGWPKCKWWPRTITFAKDQSISLSGLVKVNRLYTTIKDFILPPLSLMLAALQSPPALRHHTGHYLLIRNIGMNSSISNKSFPASSFFAHVVSSQQ